ncbi:MAG: TonB-dependent receptor, partial [Kangiellaceae bacterium]|nr:TonB-dependent receptor [Kangiellaceae bacterium]
QQTHQFEQFKLYSYLSATRSEGDDSRFYLVDDNDELGYVGEDFLFDTEPLVYFGDYQDDPQIKLHLDAEFSHNWRLWFRYTQQGSHWKGNEVKTDFNGQLLNQQGTRDRQWTLTLDHKTELSDSVKLNSTISLDSFDGERRIGNARFPDPDSVLNFRINYSETEFFAKSILNWKTGKESELAAGLEYSHDRYGPGWGDSRLDLRLGDNADIVSGPDSNAILAGNRGSADRNGPPIFVGGGWSTNTYALFAEYNTKISQSAKLVTSGRLDKSVNSDWLFSPRLALILNLNENQFLRFIAQESHRFNNAGEVYIESINGEDASSESLTNYEINYSAFFKAGHNFKAAIFWNDLEIISWNGDENASLFVGEQEVAGLELEYEYQWDAVQLGLNYSFVKQQDWQLAEGLSRSGVSYSDYNQPLDGIAGVMTGTGDDINNWPNHAFKAYLNWEVNDSLNLHFDIRSLWDFQGAKDGLLSLENAVQGETIEAEVINALSQVRAQNVYEQDIRLNVSLVYQLTKDLELSAYFHNLLDSSDSKRYAEDSGNDDPAPRKVRFTVEPSAIGIKIKYRW